MDGVKRVLAGLFLLGLSAAGVYGYTLSERERTYRQRIADGDAALSRDNTGEAIEAFSGAITVKSDSMLGYLKRGQAYRRRGEFVAAIRDLRRASEIDPAATRPLEELGDAYLADTPHRYNAAAERFLAYVKLDNRAPRVLYKLAFARYNDGRLADAAAGARGAGGSVWRPGSDGEPADATRSAERPRSGPVPRSRAWPGLRARRAAGAGGSDARPRQRTLSRPSLRLRRARTRLARHRAGAHRSRGAEQGDRGARRGGRERRQQRGADALRPRAADDVGRGGRRAHVAGRDAEAAGRAPLLLLSVGGRRAPPPLRRRASSAAGLRGAPRRRAGRPPPQCAGRASRRSVA